MFLNTPFETICLIFSDVSGLTLISHGIKEKGKALGIHGIAGSAGITLAPIITRIIISIVDIEKKSQ